MKKLCSILLVTLIIFSSITCMFIGVHAESSDMVVLLYPLLLKIIYLMRV